MTKSQKKKLFSVFDCTDTEIHSIYALDFLIHTWDQYDDLQDAFEMTNVKEVFGKKIARLYDEDDGDLAGYLQEKGGIFIYAHTRIPDCKTVEFGKDGKTISYFMLPYSNFIGVWAPDYDKAICKLAAKSLKMKNAEIKKARKTQGLA